MMAHFFIPRACVRARFSYIMYVIFMQTCSITGAQISYSPSLPQASKIANMYRVLVGCNVEFGFITRENNEKNGNLPSRIYNLPFTIYNVGECRLTPVISEAGITLTAARA